MASVVSLGEAPLCYGLTEGAPQNQPTAAQSAVARRIGAIKSINGTTITLAPDSGSDVSVAVQSTTRIVRIAPGEKNLKNATLIQLQDLQVGDRILAGGTAASDEKSLLASSIVVMKRSDVEARHEQDLQDWQKRGVGGLVAAVDAAMGTITITVTGFGGSKNVTIHTSKDTVIRRYAPDSVKFDDAKPGTLEEIHNGDQLRARGDRNADGTELAAVEIVSGSFRNIAGAVNSIDASSSNISVQDLLSKKTVVVKASAESQLRQLPAEMAQRIAMRLKGAAAGGLAGVGPGTAANANSASGETSRPAGAAGAMGTLGGGRGGAPDFQQMLSRVPAVTLNNLHKGDAVLIVATSGTSSSAGTVITLVSGVEPILQAAPNAGQAMMLAPWSLSAPAEAGSQ
ncbi:MAG: DUF5666 domain-containing protein [Candidatus Sulfotelmatobacter sp.]